MQRDVPGIDHSFLAMDTEEGVEVVWNEVQFSERKYFKTQEVHFFVLQYLSPCTQVYKYQLLKNPEKMSPLNFITCAVKR